MAGLQRQQLVRLTGAAWERVLAGSERGESVACLEHWAAQGLPLVVGRQPSGSDPRSIDVGLPAPLRWGRQRLRLRVRPDEIAGVDRFPALDRVAELPLPRDVRSAVHALGTALAACRTTARVYGGYGWQLLTGLDYLRPQSDLDLLLEADSPAAADALAAELARFAFEAPRLDGEIVFADGRAVAWREWREWRAGRSARILVKGIRTLDLVSAVDWPTPSSPALAA